MLDQIKAFILGVREFRSSFTTSYDEPLIESYDKGREMAHKLTFRKWDDCA
jgi:hypothetical protein